MTEKLPFVQRLDQGVILADGAMGTMLHASGVSLDACFDELNLSQPALVFDVHRQYLEAGAEIIETNTFGANRFKLAEHGLDGKVTEINRAGGRLARQAVEAAALPNVYVAGSVGPLGVRLAPFGRVSTEQAYEAFHEQIAALCEAEVDLLILETFSDLYEIREAARAAADICPDMPVVAQVTFTRDDRTMLGDTPAQVAETLADLGVTVIGVNCSNGPAQILRIVGRMQRALAGQDGIRFSAVPNAGWPEYVGGRVMYTTDPEYFADFAVALREQGLKLVGGCCGTTPEHISAMRQALNDPAATVHTLELEDTLEIIHDDTEAAPPSELAVKIQRGDFVIAVEISPPKGIVTNKVLRAAQMLRDAGADVVDVTDSPMARMRMSPWAVCHLLQTEAGVETVLHFPTRGRNLLRVQGDLLAAHALGVRNLFVVMGDPTHIGDYPDAADNYDIVPSGLVRLIKQSLNAGEDWAGNRIGQFTNFLVCCAVNLNASDLAREFRVLGKKLDSGADYLLSQPIYDTEIYGRFLDAYTAEHGSLDIPILVGLLPLYGERHARFLHNEVPGITIPETIMVRIAAAGEDAPREGVRIAQELALELRRQYDVRGFYIMPQFGRYDLAAEIIETVRSQA